MAPQSRKRNPANGNGTAVLTLGPEVLQGVLQWMAPHGRAQAALACRMFNTAARLLVEQLQLPLSVLTHDYETQLRAQRGRQQQPPPGSAPQHLAARLFHSFSRCTRLVLYNNSITAAAQLQQQLQLLATLPRLAALELRDAQRWRVPCPLTPVSQLTRLTELRLLLQSPGALQPGAMEYGAPLSLTPASWQLHLGRELAGLSVLQQLRSLQLRCVCGERGFFTSSAFVGVVRPLTKLTHLDLGYVHVTRATLPALVGLTRLQSLILYGDHSALRGEDLTNLAPLVALRRLELFHDGVLPMDVAVAAAMGGPPPVPHFDVAAIAAAAGQPPHAIGAMHPPLVLPPVQPHPPPPAAATAAAAAPPVGPADPLDALRAAFEALVHLSWLNLPISSSTAAALPLIRHLPSLQELYLQNIDVEQTELDGRVPPLQLAGLVQGLSTLQLDNVQFTPGLVSVLSPLTTLTQLTLFNICPYQVTRDALTQLRSLTRLRQFCFDTLLASDPASMPQLDDDALTALAGGWTALSSLHFSYAQLQPEQAAGAVGGIIGGLGGIGGGGGFAAFGAAGAAAAGGGAGGVGGAGGGGAGGGGPAALPAVELGRLSLLTALRDLSLSCGVLGGAPPPGGGAGAASWVRVNCASLPRRLRSLCLNNIAVRNVRRLPASLSHVWLADVGLDAHDAAALAARLTALSTLVLKRSSGQPQCVDPPVLSALSRRTALTTLGVSLAPGCDVSLLSPLSTLSKLILDWDSDTPLGPGGAPGGGDWDQALPPPAGGLDADSAFAQLAALAACLPRLRGLWLSDGVVDAGNALLWQHLLQRDAPFLTLRACSNDWFWRTGFPIGACLDVENPIEWWRFGPWNIL